MSKMSSNKGTRRKLDNSVSAVEPPSKSYKATLLNLLLEIPADTNTTLPVWEAIKSQKVHVSWTTSPYSITVRLNPTISKQSEAATSSESENTSSVSQTSAPSSGILQPQMVIQSITQQQGVPENTSCVVLTFPSPPGDPQKVCPNPIPATSLMVSLPLLITQPQPAAQPSTSTKVEVLPAVPTKLQAPSKAPAATQFHTKSSSRIRICENFLLNMCRAGKRCKMHHTPYPFHWQLWCVTTKQWVSFPPRSQVLLEKIYSNVYQEFITITDGNAGYNLAFDSMEMIHPLKYSKARRLSNPDSTTGNPFFASKWKLYWWSSLSWEEYDKDLSTQLLHKMHEKESECSFHIGKQEYTLNFTTMTQTNVNTKFQREVRCRPVYQSPESMRPYLQTQIQTVPTSDPPEANFSVDPLEEFSSWYPPVWCPASEQDCRLVDVPLGTQAYSSVQKLFFETMSETELDIVSIQQIQNVLHWDKYQRQKAFMQKQRSLRCLRMKSLEPLERHLFHGTTKDASEGICHNNFDPRLAGVNGTSYGFGSYFATTASFSDRFSAPAGPDKVCRMFLAKVLVGKVSVGQSAYRRPPPLNPKAEKYRLYDTCVDRLHKPTMFVVFDPCQCYPYYMIKYKRLPKEVEI